MYEMHVLLIDRYLINLFIIYFISTIQNTYNVYYKDRSHNWIANL